MELDIDGMVSKEARKVASLFTEDVSLSLWELRSYPVFKVASVDGRPAAHVVTVALYYDQAYLPFSERDPSYRLVVADRDVRVRYGQVGNVANIEMRVLGPGAERDPKRLYPPQRYLGSEGGASLRSLLAEAYQMGGYGDRPELRNSDGIAPGTALAMADEALGGRTAERAHSPAQVAERARRAAQEGGYEDAGLSRGRKI